MVKPQRRWRVSVYVLIVLPSGSMDALDIVNEPCSCTMSSADEIPCNRKQIAYTAPYIVRRTL